MSDEREAALRSYVALLQAHMGLVQWGIVIALGEPEEGCVIAHIDPIEGRYFATLRVAARFWTDDPDTQRATLVHELVHLIHLPASEPVRCGTYRQMLPRCLADALWEETRRGFELTTDHVTTLLARHMPDVPSWPGEVVPA